MTASNVMELTGKRVPQTMTVRFRRGVNTWGGKDAKEFLSWCNGPHQLPANIASSMIAQHRADQVEPGTPKDNGPDHKKERIRVGIDPQPDEPNDPVLPVEQRDPQTLRTRR